MDGKMAIGSRAMSLAVLSGLSEQQCGQDIVKLAAVDYALPNCYSQIIKQLSSGRFRRDRGDLSMMLSLMDALCAHQHQHGHAASSAFCRQEGFSGPLFKNFVHKALDTYRKINRALRITRFRAAAGV